MIMIIMIMIMIIRMVIMMMIIVIMIIVIMIMTGMDGGGGETAMQERSGMGTSWREDPPGRARKHRTHNNLRPDSAGGRRCGAREKEQEEDEKDEVEAYSCDSFSSE